MWRRSNLRKDHINLLRYWRNSLVDADRINASISRRAEEITADELEAGKLAPISMDRLGKKIKGAKTFTGDQRIPVLLCPLQLKAAMPHGYRSSEDRALLWIPADLTPAGELHAREDEYPWISRSLLEPSSGEDVGFTVGSLDGVEKFLLDNPPKLVCQDWKSLVQYGLRMAEAVVEKDLPEYSWQCKVYIMLDEDARQVSMQLVKLYDSIIAEERVVPLLEKYLSLADAPVTAAMSLDEALDQAFKHCGQMGAAFPLARSQRESLHHFLALEEGEILVVNGPPGTGKTTLLHSVIASLWVEAALRGSDPPIIVAVSANNQAVTNIIDSFGRVLEHIEGNLLAERWLPEVYSYGLYFPAANRQEKAESRFQVASTSAQFPANSGFLGKVENREYLAGATGFFLQKCERFFGFKPSTVDAARSALHRELRECVRAIQKNISEKKGVVLRRKQLLSDLDALRSRFGINTVSVTTLPNALCGLQREVEAQEVNIQERLGAVEKEIAVLAGELKRWHDLQEAWRRYRSAEPLWWKVFRFLPTVKRKRQARLTAFLQCHGLKQAPGDIGRFVSAEMQSVLKKKAEKETKKELLVTESQRVIVQKQDLRAAQEDAEKLLCELEGIDKEIDGLDSFLRNLDVTLRHKAFLLATHYWEARWLAEVGRMHELDKSGQMPTGREKMKRKLKLYAMLTPCMVATLYMLPRVFSISSPPGDAEQKVYPLYEFADLLIIDEAGQVSPDLAAPAFALARKALVIGDCYQIEPVYKVPKPVDIGNLVRHGVIQERGGLDRKYDSLKAKGIAVSSGCAMTVAQRACRFQKYDPSGNPYPERGMFLSEHYRCLDVIIDYCNRLAYSGRLEPKRGSVSLPGGLPPFGYLRVLGQSRYTGGSRSNEKEADAILEWLLAYKERLEELYGEGEKRIFEIVAIVTPFVVQKRLFNNKLRSSRFAPLRGKKKEKIITAGTVHALQGAERHVVVFSPVCTAEDGNPADFFFNRSKNMLNVAVSRAKDSFLVFGDLNVFQIGDQGLPSRLLGEYLFSEPENDLSGWT